MDARHSTGVENHAQPGGESAAGTDVDIAVIGAGFGGLGAAIRVRQAGWRDFVVFEAADDIGGTWRDNSYPGCACDVPSHLYSFSFAPNPMWSDTYSGQREIWDYLRSCVDRFGIRPHLRLATAVRELAWNDADGRWHIDTSAGHFSARVVISATGPLSDPALPDLPGLASFTGTVFHSARWRHDHDLTGRRVAVVGTGASAIQFVPEIAPQVEQLTLFQRTPAWVIPRRSRPIRRVEHRLFRAVPLAQKTIRTAVFWAREWFAVGFLRPRLMRPAQKIAAKHLAHQVPDLNLRAKLTPDYTMGCKRVLISNTYYPALARDNVEVVTSGIREIGPHGVISADGVEHAADTIIFGTGFHVTDVPIAKHVHGRNGQLLADAWHETMTAYLGTTVAGFPNLFLLLGPNTGLGHNSVVLMIEAQLKHVLKALDHLKRNGFHTIEPTERAQREFVARVDAKMRPTVWMQGGCRSWYLDAGGRNSTLWPGFVPSFRRLLGRFRPAAYMMSKAPAAAPVGASRSGA
jgi:cation diffusion facilitator CzcD-associated flavoprotein CzcO